MRDDVAASTCMLVVEGGEMWEDSKVFPIYCMGNGNVEKAMTCVRDQF